MTEDELKAWDRFAAAALAGLMPVAEGMGHGVEGHRWRAGLAATYADELIAERRKRALTVKR